MARVVVVGAGLAGLAAAESLVASGVDVVVVEARERVGGRVHSRGDGFADGQHAEGGAEFVNADHTEVLDLAHRFAIALERAAPASGATTIDAGGRVAPWSAWDEASGGRLGDDLARWQAALAAVSDGIDPDDPLRGDVARELDGRTAASFVGELALSPIARVVVGRELRTEYMVPPEELSLLHVAWMHARRQRCGAVDGETDGWEAFRLSGGNDAIARGMATSLGDAVRLGIEVRCIDAGGTGAAVTVAELRDGSSAVEHADAAIVTVPIPALARITIEPALPGALFDIGYGTGAKISVQVARRVWRDLGRNGSVISDRAYGEVWETSVAQPGDSGVITALLSSHDGSAMAALPDAEHRVVAEIERAFPGASGLAGATCTTDWTNDRWSLGTYAAFAPGQLSRSWHLLRRPHGRVVLAGEHTDGYAGFMEGALRSGRRAARQVLDLLA